MTIATLQVMRSTCAVAFNNEGLYDSGAAGYCVVKGHVGTPPNKIHLHILTLLCVFLNIEK